MKKQFIKDIQNYLLEVDSDNFSQKYDGLILIITKYNEKGLGKLTIISSLNQFYDDYSEILTVYQDEVYLEVINCILGFCTISQQINLVNYENSP